jgi:cytidine deaminase
MSELDAAQLELLKTAEQAAEQSYSPYSRFAVGAAVRWDDGSVTTGTNVENLSYGLTLCAERAAVVAGVGGGQRKLIAVAVWVAAEQLANPCGACLQVLTEFSSPDTDVLLGGKGQPAQPKQMKDFLPNPFQADLA